MLCLVLGFSSCNDFLDQEPTNSANAEDAIATTSDAQVALNGIMRAMSSSSYYGRNMLLYGDVKGGDVTIFSAGRGMDGLYSFNHSATSGSYSGFWSRGYYCLNQVNNLLINIEKLEGEGQTGFDSYKGQAYTLRALMYFDLVRLYGKPYNYDKSAYGVPDITTVLDATAQPTRATVEENYKRILSDLQLGATALSADKSLRKGFVGYYANKALEARVKLYMEDYSGALAAAKEVIESGKYTLYSPSEWVDSWKSKYGSESILELGIDTESDLGTSSLGIYYLRAKQKPYTSVMGYFMASEYFLDRLGEDPDDVRWGVMDYDESSETRLGCCYKYLGGTDLSGDGGETATACNIKIIRLSEMYLIAAECALQTGDAESAADYLNAIRKRAPNLEPATEATVSIQMILDERSKELFGEGHRFFDMIRLNQSIEFNDDWQDVPVSHREKVIDRTFYKTILPIDQDEINANPAIASQQNPGY